MTATHLTLDELTDQVTLQTGRLEGPAEAVAVLESIGITDEIARDLGWVDVFQLGNEVFEHQYTDLGARQRQQEVEAQIREDELEKRRPSNLSAFIPRFFLKGFTFGAPMAIMVFAVLILLYSLWAYFFFDIPRGSAIGVAIVASYLVTAGFMQAIGRRGLMYLRQDLHLLSLKISMALALAGVIAVLVSAVLLWIFLELFPVVAPTEIPVAIAYYVAFSLMWLGLSVVYMLEQEIWFSLAVTLGIAVVYFLREYLRTPIVAAHLAGILTVALVGLIVGTVIVALREVRARETRREELAGRLPRFSVIVYSVAPYFVFGVVYFAFLFTDRVMAWTGRADFRQYFVWFQSNYEIGLNWALLGLLLSFGILEFTVYRLGEIIPYLAQLHTVRDVSSFTRSLTSFYRRAVVAYVVSAVVGAVLAYVLVRLLIPRVPLIASLIDGIAVFVFVIAAIAYLLIVWSLLNNVFLFSFSRPELALRAVLPALLVNLIVGFLASRLIFYWAAVFGLLAGGIVYWAVSSYYAIRMLRNMDYYAYAAF